VNRATLREPVRVPARGTAPGLFTGAASAVTIEPAPAGHGVRIAAPGAGPFPATVAHLDTRPAHPAFETVPPRHTNLAAAPDAPPVFTVEHLLGALAGLGVTDALVRIEGDGPVEVPIFDGSARPLVEAIARVGLAHHAEPLRWVRLPRPVEVDRGDALVRCDPCDPHDASYQYDLSYDHAFLGSQSARWHAADPGAFARNVAPARTFSLEAEATAAQAAGLFRGFTPRDLLVITDDGPIDNALRFDNEPATHKLLDLIGDLALAAHELGGPIAMRVRAHKSGHALHHLAAEAIVRAVRGT